MSSLLPSISDSATPVPEIVVGYVSIRSQGTTSCFDLSSVPATTTPFHASKQDRKQALKALESMKFTILAESRMGASISGKKESYEELTGGTLATKERLLYTEAGRQRYVTHVDVVGKGQPEAVGYGRVKAPTARIEGVVLERPRFWFAIFPSPLPPAVSRQHLRVPDDIAMGLGTLAAHRRGHRGNGVRIAMVDSGQFAHPYFAAHGYNVRPAVAMVPGTSPGFDPHGHGTGESANIFAVAPEAELQPIRASNSQGQLVAAIAGFLHASNSLNPAPAIISNSWGGDGPFPPAGPPDPFDVAWALEIADTIGRGIVVAFAAGNGQFSIEPQVPGVLAAGGVFMENDMDLFASNYASGYQSPWFPGRVVPDVCGFVGQRPRAAYIMLPIPPGCPIDVSFSARVPGDPPDGTTSNDGWALFSGTSAACPQLAGAAALVLSARANATPAQVVQALTATAVDVTAGNCHPRFNNSAVVGPDSATGAGLANASAAVQFAIDNF